MADTPTPIAPVPDTPVPTVPDVKSDILTTSERLTLGKIVKQIPAVLGDAAKLDNPAVAASVGGVVIGVLAAFGVHTVTTGIVVGVLGAVGILATAAEKAYASVKSGS